jgi:transcriptional regulator with XRE-family HTH domain
MHLDGKIGLKIKQARLRTGLSQTKVAEQVGLSQQYLSGIENGHYSIDVSLLCRLAKLFGVRVQDCLPEDCE